MLLKFTNIESYMLKEINYISKTKTKQEKLINIQISNDFSIRVTNNIYYNAKLIGTLPLEDS